MLIPFGCNPLGSPLNPLIRFCFAAAEIRSNFTSWLHSRAREEYLRIISHETGRRFGYSPLEKNAPGTLWADKSVSPEDIAFKGVEYLHSLLDS